MKKYRINTTISQTHHELLKKHAKEFGTQQRVLEYALENIGNNLNRSHKLSSEEELWMRIGRELKGILLFIQKDCAKMLLETADIERFKGYVTYRVCIGVLSSETS